jgi:hypothetical protein
MTLWLGLNSDSMTYKLYKFNGSKSLKFDSSFDQQYLLKSYKTNDLIKCISINSKEISAKAISFEENNDSTNNCKSYSSSNVQSTDILMATSTKSMIYLRNEMAPLIHSYNCKYM